MQKIKKDDLVVVIAGKDKDKQGKVLSVDVKKNKVLVQGCNMVTKHTKQSPANPQGGIVNQEAPIDISNVMLDNKELIPCCTGMIQKEVAERIAYSASLHGN